MSPSTIASSLARRLRLDRAGSHAARHLDALIALGCFAIVAAIATWVPAWTALERRVFDYLTVTTARGEITQPLVLVAINEDSMNALQLRWPWPRKLHAELVDRIALGGAAVIALDILMAEPSGAEDDAALAKAIQKAGNVVMAADFVYSETTGMRLWRRTDPLPAFTDAGAFSGLATITYDPDQFVRRVPEEPDAFWRQIVKVLQVRAPSHPVPPLPDKGALIRYMGADNIFDPIPYHLVLEATPEELKQVFGGRIVLVGRDLRATPELGMSHPDHFATPFLSAAGTLTSGIKLHATIVDNALSGQWLRSLGSGANLALDALAALLAFLGMRRWRPLRGFLTLVAIVAVFSGLAWFAFAHERLWIVAATPIATAALAYVSYILAAYLTESRRKRELQRAFSLYVSAEVVGQVVDDPARLKLGGQRREITVMFTDLAGFTTLTEKTAPDVVQQVLTRHFTMLTGVIFERKGTVVQFMGDGLMAFWNAPLDDPDHAFHAMSAAIEAQKGMEALRAELREAGLPEVKMRVGLNTCEAVVGNFGSESRFAYSAMGDGVNLASRLEGCNKLYGTPILASGETVAKLGGRLAMRRVDRIKVAGKALAVDVYTPMSDSLRAERTARAFDLYAKGDLEGAAAIYAQLRAEDEEDRVAVRLLERIENWKRDPSLATEDGSVALDKM
ncbi:MAG TPA: adenylate/guanylate cyclase domain-containing protein [Usitatibacter sp.]|nr:adenylate/guanylate cyclase domain-containing protein [Usitatibacter sp.]